MKGYDSCADGLHYFAVHLQAHRKSPKISDTQNIAEL